MTQAFNLSQLANKVNTSGQLDVATGVTGTQAVANGGTGQSTYTDGQLLIGNSTGNTLTKATITAGSGITVTNGSGAITIAASGGAGNLETDYFTSPGTWTKPASCTQVRVTVIGAGGGAFTQAGGSGGLAMATVPVSAPVSVTIGTAGSMSDPASSGGTSSFGPAVSCTGGSGGSNNTTGSAGSGTVSVGSAIRTSTNVAQYTSIMFGSTLRTTPGGRKAWSASSNERAGSGGAPFGPGFAGSGGIDGLVIVEYVE